MKNNLPIQKILKEYNEGASLHEIAENYNTYANKIRRLLKKLGVKTRDKSEAQSNALKRDRKKHPTAGRERTDEEKLKISEKLAGWYDKLTESEYNSIRERAKDNWKNVSKKQRAEMQRKSAESNRIAAKEGSAVEKYVKEVLEEEGYVVKFHQKNLLKTDLELDIFLPKENVAIEIDGPSHREPIWGPDSLKRQITYDINKNGVVLSLGLVLIRVKYDRSTLNLHVKNQLKIKILELLSKIRNKFPAKNNRLIELEV